MKNLSRSVLGLILLPLLLVEFAFASNEIRFTSRELDAAYVLVRPELNVLEVNGKSGRFTPAPALRFFGFEEQRFEIDFNSIADLADLRFNQLRARAPELKFTEQALELRIPIDNQEKVLKSRLGTISIDGVALVAQVGFVSHPNGNQSMALLGARLDGNLRGTGLLKSQWILGKVRELLVKTLNQQVRQILSRPFLQESVLIGLETWSRFYTGIPNRLIVPGTIRFFKEDYVSGLRFEVQ
jgi:hypothetical protein